MRSGFCSAPPAVKSEYGRFIIRIQRRTALGTGKNSANGTR